MYVCMLCYVMLCYVMVCYVMHACMYVMYAIYVCMYVCMHVCMSSNVMQCGVMYVSM